MDLTDDDIAEILKLVDTSPFDDVEIEWKGMVLRLNRNGSVAPSRTGGVERSKATGRQSSQSHQETDQTNGLSFGQAKNVPDQRPLGPGESEILSPVVGTFYRRPEPGADPFVDVGTQVSKEDTLCLMEVMKVFTGVTAETDAKIVEICAEDGKPVEYGQRLFIVAPTLSEGAS